MGTIILVGDGLNAAAYGSDLSSPAADSLFPPANLVDGRIDLFWRQGSIAANSYLRRDLNRVQNGGFESATLAPWASINTGGGIIPVKQGAFFKSGSNAVGLGMGGSAGTSLVSQDIAFRSADKVRGLASLYATGTSAVGRLEIFEPRSGLYLNSSNAWQTAQAYHKSTVGLGAWEDFTLAFTLPTRSQTLSDMVALRLRAVNAVVNTNMYADDIYLWTEVNTALLAGHNVPPAIPMEFRSSADNFAANDVLVGTIAPRLNVAWYYQTTAVVTRYVQIKFVGTPAAAIRATECVFGYALAPSETPSWGFTVRRRIPQARSAWQAVPLADFSADSVVLGLQPAYSTQWSEIEEIMERASAGQMIIAVPDTNRSTIFIGRTPEEWAYKATSVAIMDAELPIDPFPPARWTP